MTTPAHRKEQPLCSIGTRKVQHRGQSEETRGASPKSKLSNSTTCAACERITFCRLILCCATVAFRMQLGRRSQHRTKICPLNNIQLSMKIIEALRHFVSSVCRASRSLNCVSSAWVVSRGMNINRMWRPHTKCLHPMLITQSTCSLQPSGNTVTFSPAKKSIKALHFKLSILCFAKSTSLDIMCVRGCTSACVRANVNRYAHTRWRQIAGAFSYVRRNQFDSARALITFNLDTCFELNRNFNQFNYLSWMDLCLSHAGVYRAHNFPCELSCRTFTIIAVELHSIIAVIVN